MTSRRDGGPISTVLLVAANLLIPAAILTFATGFFPYKPFLPGLAQYDSLPEYGDPPSPPFDRLVFMVVDALRSDFVYAADGGFSYTQSLIRTGAALPFTAHATSPTVTMPRLKAITTGSIPSFLDVILNIDEGDETSTLASQDTWLAQMKAKGTGRLVMYGDDTWLKLFPDTFDRADGTTSFFVADFTEVDNNVTRHIADELQHDDWNTMVLHYLGLDHIGHKGGPRSSNMYPKQREMDTVVEQIFTALESKEHLKSTLFVMCGDHGMNDAGNHGASSPGETSPALVFMSPKLKTLQKGGLEAPLPTREDFQYYSVVEQSDLAPTLGALLGFPTPKNNLGAMIPEFLPYWSNNVDQIQILMRNAHQILGIVNAAFGTQLFGGDLAHDACTDVHTDIQELACEWQRISKESSAIIASEAELDDRWISATTKWLRKAQGLMSSMASNYDMPRMVLGQVIAVIALACAVLSAYMTINDPLASSLPFGAITLAYGVMMFASSYVEEEQHFWYWTTTAWLGALAMRQFVRDKKFTINYGSAAVLALVATRAIRGWNQTGQKFAGEPDFVKIFLYPNPVLLWCLVILTYLIVGQELTQGLDGLPGPTNNLLSVGLTVAALTFKLAFTNEAAPELVVGLPKTLADMTQGISLVVRARAVFIGLLLATTCVMLLIFTKKRVLSQSTTTGTLHHIYATLAMTQSRATNIPLFLLFDFQRLFLDFHQLGVVDLSTTMLLLQYSSFFAFGGTNAISSVDLSSAYNGIAGFDVGAVGVLTFLSNWAAPIFWTSATAPLLRRLATSHQRQDQHQHQHQQHPAPFKAHAAVLTVFATFSVAAVMAACTVLRTHLFVWTVFSPKYLYCMAWTLGQHLIVNIGFGGLLYWLGQF